MSKIESTLFCDGVGCIIRPNCHRYVDGTRVDPHAVGFSWMESCDIEHRSGYMPISFGK